MSARTDNTEFARQSYEGLASLGALLDHLRVMSGDDIGIGVVNAQAAGAAYELLGDIVRLEGLTASDGTPVILPDPIDVS